MTAAVRLKLGTRKSPLAIWQAEHVAAALVTAHPALVVEICRFSTQGDRILDAPLSRIGGKGLFVKEIEEALLDGRIDLAVHSLKDMPAQLPTGLSLAVWPQRADPRDAWVSGVASPLELPKGARVGTSSMRRACQLLAARPDLNVVSIRGSVQTRLEKLQTEKLDAVVLAAAGLDRLGLGEQIRTRLEPEQMLPAVGQGILAVEIRTGDDATLQRLAPLHHPPTAHAGAAERAMLAALGGGCQVPIAGHALQDAQGWWLRGMVAFPDGTGAVNAQGRASGDADVGQLQALGRKVAQELLDGGGRAVLESLGINPQGAQAPPSV